MKIFPRSGLTVLLWTFGLSLWTSIGSGAEKAEPQQQQPQLNDKLLIEDLRKGKAAPQVGEPASASGKVASGEPAVIDPGPVGGPPSDAIVLFNGQDLSQWKGISGSAAKWKVE